MAPKAEEKKKKEKSVKKDVKAEGKSKADRKPKKNIAKIKMAAKKPKAVVKPRKNKAKKNEKNSKKKKFHKTKSKRIMNKRSVPKTRLNFKKTDGEISEKRKIKKELRKKKNEKRKNKKSKLTKKAKSVRRLLLPKRKPRKPLPKRKIVIPVEKMPKDKSKKKIVPKQGDVLILLSGKYKGKRVVCLREYKKGVFLITGPFCVNGVPLRRVNRRYCIVTSTHIDLQNHPFRTPKGFFERRKKRPNKGKPNKRLDPTLRRPKTYMGKIQQMTIGRLLQKKIDRYVLQKVKKADPLLPKYLASRFTLSRNDRPHDMKF